MRALRTRLAVVLISVALPNVARADFADSAKSAGELAGYSVPIAGGAVATVVNGFHIAYGEGAPRGWRIAGYAFGGVDLVMGALLLSFRHDTSEQLALGIVPLVVGTTSILTALFAPIPDDIVGPAAGLCPVLTPNYAGVAWTGVF